MDVFFVSGGSGFCRLSPRFRGYPCLCVVCCMCVDSLSFCPIPTYLQVIFLSMNTLYICRLLFVCEARSARVDMVYVVLVGLDSILSAHISSVSYLWSLICSEGSMKISPLTDTANHNSMCVTEPLESHESRNSKHPEGSIGLCRHPTTLPPTIRPSIRPQKDSVLMSKSMHTESNT